MAPKNPAWPAMLQFAHAAELTYFVDEQAWQQFIQQANHWHAEDRLIDSLGSVFEISIHGPMPVLTNKGFTLGLDQVVELLQMHLADAGQCCVTKAGADSILDALHQLASMAD